MKKILVLDGGGQLGAFQWGAMTELHNHSINYSFFDCYVATSAGAFNACYFLAEQIGQGTRLWLEHLPSGFWKFFKNDINYLECLLKEIEPLNCCAVASRKQKIYAALSNAETQKAEYLCLDNPDKMIEILLACGSMPFLSKQKKLDNAEYYDGSLTAQPPIQKALEFNSAEIWVICNKPVGYRVSNAFWKAISALQLFHKGTRKLLYNYPESQNKTMEILDNRPNFQIIRPDFTLPIGFRSTNKFMINKTFELGKKSARKFLAKRFIKTKK